MLEGTAERLDEFDDVGGVEGLAVVAGYSYEKRLNEGKVDGEDEVLGFGIWLVLLEIGITVAGVGEGVVILEDVVGDVVFEDVGVAAHEWLQVEAVGVSIGGEDVLLAGGSVAAEAGFKVLDALEEPGRDGRLGEAAAEQLHDELELLGGFRLDLVHEGAEALECGDAGAVGEHVGNGGGVGLRPVGDGAGSTEGFEAASEDAEEIHALPEGVIAVGDEG